MIRSKILVAAACITVCTFAVSTLASCKSTPQEEPAVEEPVKDEPVQEEEPVEEPAQDFGDSNEALLKKVEESRKAASDAGAASANEAAFKAAEAELASVKAALKADSSADMSAALKDLNNRYQALLAFANAKAKKDRIDSLDFAHYDQTSYDSGANALEELSDPESLVSLGSGWYKKAKGAEDDFDKVLDTAFRSLAREERTAAFVAKKDADSVKAAVSRKDEYNKGVEFFKSGDSKYVTSDPEGAMNSYISAKNIFTDLFTQISNARAKAQAAIEAAKARVAESEDIAEEADRASPLGDAEVEGIEDADTTLLEADDFTETENAAAELEDSVEETVEEGAE